ncbi:uncharacterized protein LOC124865374 [Girardinichthys multiradiatus]|uniref:uncharacterized protein LOC124865374 n=1 Tax=Girardinichthys multiradiatus TaxID=208333 RepID=UPI001FADF5DF|nr:uncharacterized protein LOC124865374 [Girardinichthys multiradiatus]
MSGGVNVKSAPRGSSSSGIPLPRSLVTNSPKTDPRRQTRDLPRPSIQSPKHTPMHTLTHSPSLCSQNSVIPGPSSREHQKDGGLKSQLYQRTHVSRSAYSSPVVQRKVSSSHSKDTMDLQKTFPAHIPSHLVHDGNHNRSNIINKNQANNLHPPFRFRGGENSNTTQKMSHNMPARGGNPPKKQPIESSFAKNGNIHSSPAQSGCKHSFRDHSGSISQSDEEMGTPEDSSSASSPDPLPLPLITFDMPVISSVYEQEHHLPKESTETHITRVNMAAVAPFSYRLRIQESDFSLEELSDCSSGSIEVCCDDLTTVH